MTDHIPESNTTDTELEKHFAQLRLAELASAPAFPGSSANRRPDNAPHNIVTLAPAQRTIYRSLPKMAAAVAALAIGVGLFMQEPQEDPAALYSDIMSRQSMQTDVFMQVSGSVLPAVYDLPRLYDTEFSYETDTLIN